MTQAQFDAAVSFAYNSRTPDIRNTLEPANRNDMSAVAQQMARHVYVHQRDPQGRSIGVAQLSPGLVNRRRRDAAGQGICGHCKDGLLGCATTRPLIRRLCGRSVIPDISLRLFVFPARGIRTERPFSLPSRSTLARPPAQSGHCRHSGVGSDLRRQQRVCRT